MRGKQSRWDSRSVDHFLGCAESHGHESISATWHHTMRFGSTAKVLAKCMLKCYRISECITQPGHASPKAVTRSVTVQLRNMCPAGLCTARKT